eukprot:Partr_v1_DN28791_c3_g1_i3_m61908 putative Solute carrier family 39 (Metal ion transporter), member 11
MIYISFFDILPESAPYLKPVTLSLAYFGGVLFMAFLEHVFPEELINRLVVASTASSAIPGDDEFSLPSPATHSSNVHMRNLLKSGWITFIGMGLHNAPEGVAVYLSTMKDSSFGLSLAFAIGCHNIPEGMSVAIPLYFATRDKSFTLKMTIINGLFEPVSVLICAILFGWDRSSTKEDNVRSETINAFLLSSVAGIMTFVSIHELYPTAIEFCTKGSGHNGGREEASRMLFIGMLIGWLVMTFATLFQ